MYPLPHSPTTSSIISRVPTTRKAFCQYLTPLYKHTPHVTSLCCLSVTHHSTTCFYPFPTILLLSITRASLPRINPLPYHPLIYARSPISPTILRLAGSDLPTIFHHWRNTSTLAPLPSATRIFCLRNPANFHPYSASALPSSLYLSYTSKYTIIQ